MNAEEGNISIRYQGRTLDRTNQETRPHIPYLIFLMHLHEDKFQYLLLLMEYTEGLTLGRVETTSMFGLSNDMERSFQWFTL